MVRFVIYFMYYLQTPGGNNYAKYNSRWKIFCGWRGILGAFFKLLKEKKPDRITVSDITKTAGIARSTFYNHYQDIPSLISAVEDKTIHDVFSMMENFQPKNDRDICSSYFLTLCRYTMENPFLSGLLSTPHGNDLFEKMLTMLHHYVTETTSNSRPDRHTKEEVSYVSPAPSAVPSAFSTNGAG